MGGTYLNYLCVAEKQRKKWQKQSQLRSLFWAPFHIHLIYFFFIISPWFNYSSFFFQKHCNLIFHLCLTIMSWNHLFYFFLYLLVVHTNGYFALRLNSLIIFCYDIFALAFTPRWRQSWYVVIEGRFVCKIFFCVYLSDLFKLLLVTTTKNAGTKCTSLKYFFSLFILWNFILNYILQHFYWTHKTIIITVMSRVWWPSILAPHIVVMKRWCTESCRHCRAFLLLN